VGNLKLGANVLAALGMLILGREVSSFAFDGGLAVGPETSASGGC
jgi:hypothetical protein